MRGSWPDQITVGSVPQPEESATGIPDLGPGLKSLQMHGTDVTDRSGQKIGEIEDLVFDKLSNNIMFAVVSFGGFLLIGDKYHPIPWSSLEYDEARDSYVVDYTKEQLEAAPAATIEELVRNDGEANRDRAFDYYKVPRYWEPQRH
jgi:hypothetical protein